MRAEVCDFGRLYTLCSCCAVLSLSAGPSRGARAQVGETLPCDYQRLSEPGVFLSRSHLGGGEGRRVI